MRGTAGIENEKAVLHFKVPMLKKQHKTMNFMPFQTVWSGSKGVILHIIVVVGFVYNTINAPGGRVKQPGRDLLEQGWAKYGPF